MPLDELATTPGEAEPRGGEQVLQHPRRRGSRRPAPARRGAASRPTGRRPAARVLPARARSARPPPRRAARRCDSRRASPTRAPSARPRLRSNSLEVSSRASGDGTTSRPAPLLRVPDLPDRRELVVGDERPRRRSSVQPQPAGEGAHALRERGRHCNLLGDLPAHRGPANDARAASLRSTQ